MTLDLDRVDAGHEGRRVEPRCLDTATQPQAVERRLPEDATSDDVRHLEVEVERCAGRREVIPIEKDRAGEGAIVEGAERPRAQKAVKLGSRLGEQDLAALEGIHRLR